MEKIQNCQWCDTWSADTVLVYYKKFPEVILRVCRKHLAEEDELDEFEFVNENPPANS